jgi:hypothetical protein
MRPAKQLCGFEPLAVWPQGIDQIRADAEYMRRHSDRLGKLFGRSEASEAKEETKKKRKLCSETNSSATALPKRSEQEISLR